MKESNLILKEGLRIKAEYERREREIDQDLYAPWQPGEILMLSERKRTAALMLDQIKRFPKAGERCLEIGYGKLGWLADFISWGMRETDLYGIELDPRRAEIAQTALPNAHLKVGDATELPWRDDCFDFVVASTVFSSILDLTVRKSIANEMTRVLARKGVVIIYDASINNPGNKSFMRVKQNEIRAMFPDLSCQFRSSTLAPPIARFVAKRSWVLAEILSSISLLRTHFLAVLSRQ